VMKKHMTEFYTFWRIRIKKTPVSFETGVFAVNDNLV